MQVLYLLVSQVVILVVILIVGRADDGDVA